MDNALTDIPLGYPHDFLGCVQVTNKPDSWMHCVRVSANAGRGALIPEEWTSLPQSLHQWDSLNGAHRVEQGAAGPEVQTREAVKPCGLPGRVRAPGDLAH